MLKNTEFEILYWVEDSTLDAILSDQNQLIKKSPSYPFFQRRIYLDTENLDIARNSCSLSLRKFRDNTYGFFLKQDLFTSTDGIVARIELAHKDLNNMNDLRAYLQKEYNISQEFKPVLMIDSERIQYLLKEKDPSIYLTFDKITFVNLLTRKKIENISTMEMELSGVSLDNEINKVFIEQVIYYKTKFELTPLYPSKYLLGLKLLRDMDINPFRKSEMYEYPCVK